MKDIRQKLLATFHVEHNEHLKCIRQILGKSTESIAASDLDEMFRRAHSLKGAARAVDVREIETLAHEVETLLSRVRSGTVPLDKGVVDTVLRALDSSEDVLGALSGSTPKSESVAPAASETVPPVFQPLETVRLLASNLDRLVNSTGELSTENLRQDQLSFRLRDIEKHMDRALAGSPEHLQSEIRSVASEVRVIRQVHDKNAWALRSLTSDLQTEVRRARMIPAENVFESFPKMMRDLAKDEGKTVDFQMSGTDVHADRVVLQALKDPLMHVLRNALSHGIEPDDERRKAGNKSRAGIQMKVEARGNRLNVSVEDNGRGLNLERIKEVALRQALLPAASVDAQSPEDLARLVFRAGFSTTRSVSQVSGRGMGLSVVAEAVARLQGKVDIQPLPDRGTRVLISVPLSISSQRLLLVSCLNQTFAIPLHGIERLYRIPVRNVETLENRPVIRVDGRHIPLASLVHMIDPARAGVRADEHTLNIAVLHVGEKRLAIAVDSFVSERDAVIKELPAIAAMNRKLAGGILLEDGAVCLVLNPAEIVAGFRQDEKALVIEAAVDPKAEKSSRILIVDDSLTTRTLEKSILEAHGYEVSVAVDGLEALTCLRSEPVGLVVTDIEMPRLDGFGLLAEMKSDAKLAGIPVIVVSSLENREQQERGLALGADAYIVKKRFEQRELLETIQQIL